MKVEIEDLQLGDEIIISSLSNLRMLKIVGPCNVKNKWNASVRCEADVENKMVDRNKWDYKSQQSILYQSKSTVWKSLSDDYKKRVTINLGGRDIWLIKRNGIEV